MDRIRHGFFHVLHLDRLIHLGHEGLEKGILQQRGDGRPNVDIGYFLIFSSWKKMLNNSHKPPPAADTKHKIAKPG